jgi:hypothetical protein
MNRTVKSVQSMVLVAIVSLVSAYLGARAVTPGVVATQGHSEIVLVDGPPKPCMIC